MAQLCKHTRVHASHRKGHTFSFVAGDSDSIYTTLPYGEYLQPQNSVTRATVYVRACVRACVCMRACLATIQWA